VSRAIHGVGLVLIVAYIAAVVPCISRALAQDRTDLFLTLLPFGYEVDATAGEDNRFFLELRNAGTTTITDIQLSSDHPDGWEIELVPGSLDTLGAGSLQTVGLNIRPAANASRGDHQVSIIATANEITKVQSFVVDVQLASHWLWVLLAAAIVAVAAFVIVFVFVGRRREKAV
jgi:uncharacterized membrane protein